MLEALPTTPALTANRESQEAFTHKHATESFHEAYQRAVTQLTYAAIEPKVRE